MSQLQIKESLDTWYKKIILIGFGLYLFSIYLEFGFLSAFSMSLIATGLILVGLGELVNHKKMFSQKIEYGPNPENKVIRRPEEIGMLLDVVGLFCFVMAIYYRFYPHSF